MTSTPLADATTEQLLARLDITHAGPQWIRLADIDWAESLEAQTRDDPLHNDTVDTYTAALEDTDTQFPPIVVRSVNDTLLILAGVHRYAAHHRAARATIPAYVVTCDDPTAHIIAVETNATHGLPLTKAERLRHAVALVDDGHTVAAAARTVGIQRAALDTELAAQAGAARSTRLQCSAPWAKIASSASRQRLQSIKSDPVFASTVEIVARLNLAGNHVADAVTRINAAPTDAEAFRILDDVEDEHDARTGRAPTGRSGGRPPAIGRLRRTVFDLMDLDAADVVRTCANRDRQRTAEHARRAARTLLSIAEALDSTH